MNNVKYERTLGICLVILYMVYSIFFSIIQDVTAEWFPDPIDIVVLVITTISIIGLWLMKKWGAALTTVLSGIGIAFNMGIFYPIRLHALSEVWGEVLAYLWTAQNSIALVLNIVVAVYIFKLIFANRFR